ncbi:UNVERIFIED_CONTAM: hypothetical protein HDU68_003642 [Siphonaria sp. JEL0065]|nr:hypothetical protein HDU68_003642 [Siphonaria sp. JEL0065]
MSTTTISSFRPSATGAAAITLTNLNPKITLTNLPSDTNSVCAGGTLTFDMSVSSLAWTQDPTLGPLYVYFEIRGTDLSVSPGSKRRSWISMISAETDIKSMLVTGVTGVVAAASNKKGSSGSKGSSSSSSKGSSSSSSSSSSKGSTGSSSSSSSSSKGTTGSSSSSSSSSSGSTSKGITTGGTTKGTTFSGSSSSSSKLGSTSSSLTGTKSSLSGTRNIVSGPPPRYTSSRSITSFPYVPYGGYSYPIMMHSPYVYPRPIYYHYPYYYGYSSTPIRTTTITEVATRNDTVYDALPVVSLPDFFNDTKTTTSGNVWGDVPVELTGYIYQIRANFFYNMTGSAANVSTDYMPFVTSQYFGVSECSKAGTVVVGVVGLLVSLLFV